MKTKNKTRYLQSILGAILAVSAALVLSCEQPDGSSVGAPAGKGSVAISVSTDGPAGSVLRTILPDEEPVWSKFELVFERGADESKETIKVPGDGEDEPDLTTLEGFEQALDLGDWTVTVTAYQKFTPTDGTETEYPAAQGSETFTVRAGELTTKTVTIKPIPLDTEDDELKDVKGIFDYSITYPDGATGSLTLTDKDSKETTVQQLNDNAGTEPNTVAASKELATGYYKLKISLTKDGLTAIDSAVVYIYAGLKSKAVFSFGDEDFTKLVYLAGSIPKLSENVEFVPIKVYTGSGGSRTLLNTAQYSTAGDYWFVSIPAANIGNKLELESMTTNSGVTYTAKATVEKLPEGGAEVDLKTEITGTGTVNYGTQEVKVADTFTVVKAVTVQIGAEGSLTAKEGTTVAVAGNLNVAGAVDLSKAGSIAVTGTLSVADGGSLKVPTSDTSFYGADKSGSLKLAQGSNLEVATGTTTVNYLGGDSPIYSWDSASTNGSLNLTANSLILTAGNLVLNQENSIQAGDKATIADGATLKVKEGANLNVGGTLSVAGELDVSGTVDLTAATVAVTGTVTVGNTGTLKVLTADTDSFYAGTEGSLVLTQGSTLTVGSGETPTEYLGGKEPIYSWDSTSSGGILTLAPDSLILTAGNLVLNKYTAIQAGDTATIADGAKLNVAQGGTLNVEGELTVGGALSVADSGMVTGATNGKIILKAGHTITGAINFYNAAGETAFTAPITATEPYDRYFYWSGTLGQNTGGWQETAANLKDNKIPYKAGFEDKEITITLKIDDSEVSENILYWLNNDTVTATAAGVDGSPSYSWELDGEPIKDATSSTLTFKTGDLAVRKHTLTVFVTKDNVVYSKEATFTVAFNEPAQTPAGTN